MPADADMTRGTLTDLAGWSLIFLAGFWAGEWWGTRRHH